VTSRPLSDGALEGGCARPPVKAGELDLRSEEPGVCQAGVVAKLAKDGDRLLYQWPGLRLLRRLGEVRHQPAGEQPAQLARPIARSAARGGDLVCDSERLGQPARTEVRVQ